ncbi:MAG TPA: universal stress protein [Hyphomicrobiales bacterium]|nr:universal stress protein [Hyphomicrobiales bacterium]
MSYATMMVHLGIGQTNDSRLAIAGDLAKRFGAHLIGISAADPLPPMFFDAPIPGEVIDEDRKQLNEAMREAHERFLTATRSLGIGTEWRQELGNPLAFVARNARAADLVIAGTEREATTMDNARILNASDLLMEVGRPTLLVPPEAARLDAARILVAWKDTRESRRAVWDALPFLKRAGRVVVAELDEADDAHAAEARVADVVAWLGRHGIEAIGTTPLPLGDAAEQIDAIARTEKADLVVAGAYGHTRFREWILGGVTRDRILHSALPSLMAH